MASIRVAERYSKSLLDLAVETGNVDQVYDDMLHFKDALQSRDLVNLLKSPIIQRNKKLNIVQKLFDEKMQQLTMKFFEVVIRKDREEVLPDIADAFFDQYYEHKGITLVKVTSAKELDDATLKNIEKKLLESGTTRRQVELETILDPDLLGGFVLEYDNKKYDVSVRNQLINLRKRLVN